jgi:hypothetical protein
LLGDARLFAGRHQAAQNRLVLLSEHRLHGKLYLPLPWDSIIRI